MKNFWYCERIETDITIKIDTNKRAVPKQFLLEEKMRQEIHS